MTSGGKRPRSSSNVQGICKECCCVVLGLVLCVLSVWNHCLLTALRKLTLSEGSLRSQTFLCLPRYGIEPKTSHTANAHSNHSATRYIYIYISYFIPLPYFFFSLSSRFLCLPLFILILLQKNLLSLI